MSPAITFFAGLFLLIIFGWYFATEIAARKRWLGLILSVLLVAFCLEAVMPPKEKIRLGLDLQGGTSFLLRLVPTGDDVITVDLLDQAVEVIRKRVDSYGVSEPVISPQGTDSILVQIPGLDTEQIAVTKEELQRVAKLEFASVAPGGEERIARIEAGEEIMPPGYVLKTYKDSVEGKEREFRLLVKRRADLGGDHVTRAYSYFDNAGYGVSLSFDSEGAKLFGDLTQALAPTRGQLAILLDGEVQSAPQVNEPIFGGNASITGRYTDKEARDLASALNNPLRVPVVIEETRSVSSTLGGDSIRSGILAGVGGLSVVILFVMVYYRVAGVVAMVGLAANFVILFGAMAMFNFVLTLPGIAGIILTIGMAVDANVLIYERLREELTAGKSLPAALEAAYNKAFSAIFDANVTTLITSLILFWLASGSVRGFAVTLMLGILASMFAALLITRTAFRWMTEKFGLKTLTMMNLSPKRTFNFLGQRRIAGTVSLILVVGSIGFLAWRGVDNLGIDFRGGDLLIVDAKQPLMPDEARIVLETIGMGDAVLQIQSEGIKDVLSIRSPVDTSDQILTELQTSFPDRGVIAVSQEAVGPLIGLQFAQNAGLAIGLSFIAIFLYVAFRFEFSFALATVAALVHDVIITLGLFALLGFFQGGGELSLVMVGAVLTIVGYSVNDTIVVFDRIREALKQGESGSTESIMNRAINETLSRTILTSGTTMMSVGALYFFGGAVLRDFSFAILVGIFVGTYSSIFVASPIVLWWSRLRRKNLRREVLSSEAAKTV